LVDWRKKRGDSWSSKFEDVQKKRERKRARTAKGRLGRTAGLERTFSKGSGGVRT